MKILLIEDSQFKIDKISQFLFQKDYTDLTVKKSYNSALRELLGVRKYDVILLDISIPTFDVSNEFLPSGGKQIFNQIHMNNIPSKVIVITLYKSFDDGSVMENLHDQFSEDYIDNYIGYIIFNNQDLKWQTDLLTALNFIK